MCPLHLQLIAMNISRHSSTVLTSTADNKTFIIRYVRFRISFHTAEFSKVDSHNMWNDILWNGFIKTMNTK